ncbi:MAG: hypothetical protein HC892_14795 [Saprospiraceae bacterium]|nr:hypothetical protein [Saprospiraceae bacterium]
MNQYSFVFAIALCGMLLTSVNLFGQTPLILGTYNKKVVPNETVCVSVYGRDFKQILSMQYSLKWDARHLQFKKCNPLGCRV